MMTKRIVQCLEVIQVDEKQCSFARFPRAGEQCWSKPIKEHPAVG
jgi:hypothetical protein